MQRLEQSIRDLEQNWVMKVVAILAAITGLAIFVVEAWNMWH
jgi:hypothetical protein